MASLDPAKFEGGNRLDATDRQAAQPLVSIVIVVFRDCNELQYIVDSILPFRTEALEIVVIDGGSTDGTVDLLRGYGNSIDYWLSEPDHGIYDAMNKGMRASTGDYILHLNAGDRLLNLPWDELRRCAAEHIDVVTCRVLLDSKVVFISRTGLLSRIDNTWHHQGTFYRRAAHLGYDTTYAIYGDFEHNQHLLMRGCTTRQLPAIVARHAGGGVSEADTGHREVYRSVATHFGWFWLQVSRLRFTLRALRARLRTSR